MEPGSSEESCRLWDTAGVLSILGESLGFRGAGLLHREAQSRTDLVFTAAESLAPARNVRFATSVCGSHNGPGHVELA